MNNLKLDVTIPDLSVLTPVGVDTYELVAKFYKLDGTPLDSSHIANTHNLTVETTTGLITLDLAIENNTYTIPSYELKLFANDELNCCFARIGTPIVNTITEVSVEGVLLSQLGSGGKVYKYEPSTDVIQDLFNAVSSSDIAHTSTKLFVYTTPGAILRIKEYNITLSPFSHVFIRDYDLDIAYYGPGLCAVSNTELYIAGTEVTQIDIVGTVATPTTVFTFAAGFGCTGDLIYDPVSELFLILYNDVTDYRVGVFERDGTIVRSAATVVNNMFGIYQFGGDTFLIDGDGQTYELNLTTLATTPAFDINLPMSGASQIQSNISIPA